MIMIPMSGGLVLLGIILFIVDLCRPNHPDNLRDVFLFSLLAVFVLFLGFLMFGL